MSEPFIHAKDLYYTYREEGSPDVPVLRGLSLDIQKGEYVAILGHNGSGKSTFAKLLNLILEPDAGELFVAGKNLTSPDLTEDDVYELRREVGMVFQNPDNQLVATIVEDDVAFGPENVGVSREEIGKRIEFALDATGTREFRDRQTATLSGGQKQRVAIAGVLALRPEILILDESTSMLDPKGREEVMSVVRKLNEEGMTVLVITHYMEEVVSCEKVFVMHKGRMIREGTPEEIFSDGALLAEAGLELPVPAKIAVALKKRGVDAGIPLTKEELKDKLCGLLRKS